MFSFTCMSILAACVGVHYMGAVPTKAKKGHQIPWNWGLTADSCELSLGYWVLNPSPLQEKQVLLITEPSLQPQSFKNEIFRTCGAIIEDLRR